VNSILDDLQFLVRREKYQRVEVPIADVPDDGIRQPDAFQILLRLQHELGEFRHRDTFTCL
jgi:hypothetical protein